MLLAWWQASAQDIDAFMDRMGLGGGAGAFGAPAAPGRRSASLWPDPEAAYASQLEQLQVCLPQTLSDVGWLPPMQMLGVLLVAGGAGSFRSVPLKLHDGGGLC